MTTDDVQITGFNVGPMMLFDLRQAGQDVYRRFNTSVQPGLTGGGRWCVIGLQADGITQITTNADLCAYDPINGVLTYFASNNSWQTGTDYTQANNALVISTSANVAFLGVGIIKGSVNGSFREVDFFAPVASQIKLLLNSGAIGNACPSLPMLDTDDPASLGTPDNPATVNISAITQANPGQVTAAGHGLVNGQLAYITGVSGMTQVNNRNFYVASATTNTFTIGVDTTSYGVYAGPSGTVSGNSYPYGTHVRKRNTSATPNGYYFWNDNTFH